MHLTIFMALLAVSGQGADRAVSATVRASPAPRAIAELARQVGEPLTASAGLQNDVLVIDVHSVPLKTLLEKIATTIHAEWGQTDGGYRLQRTDAMRRKELEEEAVAEAQVIEDALAGEKKQLGEIKPIDAKRADELVRRMKIADEQIGNGGDSDSDIYGQVLGQSPSMRAFSRVLNQVRPIDLARLPTGKRIVYSARPTPMQQRWPNDLTEIVSDFARERGLMGKAVKRTMGETESRYEYGNDDSIYGMVEGPPAKVLVVIEKDDSMDTVTIELMIANTKGQLLGHAQDSIFLNPDFLLEDKEIEAKMPKTGEAVKLCDDAKELAAYLTGRTVPQTKLSDGLRARILAPQEFDPLSYGATDVILACGRAKKANVVAQVRDSFAYECRHAKDGMKVDEFLNTLLNPFEGGKVADGWFTVSPLRQSKARLDRVDRASLAALLRDSAKRGAVGLASASVFASKNVDPLCQMMVRDEMRFLGVNTAGFASWGWLSLRLNASLTPTQIKAFEAHQSLPMRSLNPLQMSILTESVYGLTNGMTDESFDLDFDGVDDSTEPAAELEYEPTEAMPNGIPLDGVLEGEYAYMPVVFVAGKYGFAGMGNTIDQLAGQVCAWEQRRLKEPSVQSPSYDRLMRGNRFEVTFTLSLTKNYRRTRRLMEDTRPNGAEFSLRNLPADLKEPYDLAYKAAKENLGDPPVQDGGTVPPP